MPDCRTTSVKMPTSNTVVRQWLPCSENGVSIATCTSRDGTRQRHDRVMRTDSKDDDTY